MIDFRTGGKSLWSGPYIVDCFIVIEGEYVFFGGIEKVEKIE
jgi:hypothetical protein